MNKKKYQSSEVENCCGGMFFLWSHAVGICIFIQQNIGNDYVCKQLFLVDASGTVF